MNQRRRKQFGNQIGAMLLICSMLIGMIPTQASAATIDATQGIDTLQQVEVDVQEQVNVDIQEQAESETQEQIQEDTRGQISEGGQDTSQEQTVSERVETPTYNEAENSGNLFTGSTNFTLDCGTSEAKMYYTLDGTEPTKKSNQFYYEEPNANISISETTTIKAYAVKAGMEDSEVLTFVLTKAERVSEPKITPSVENFQESAEITMASETEGTQIYYTTDGKEPTETTGTLYTGTFQISETTSIQAIAVKAGMNVSFVTYKTYTKQSAVKLKENTEYMVSAHIVTDGFTGDYGYHDFSGFYGDSGMNYKMKLKTDANGNGTISIPCIYKWLYDDYIMDLQFFTDATRTTMVEGYTFETVAGSGNTADELKATGTLPLPNHEVSGIYYGVAETVEEHDGFIKTDSGYKGNVELRIEWDTLKEIVTQAEAPTFSAPDEPDSFEEKTFKVYGTLIDSTEDPDSVDVPFMFGTNGFLGMYGPELTVKQGADGQKTVVMNVLSGINWDTFATIYFKDMKIYTDKEKQEVVSDLAFSAVLGTGSVSYTMSKEAVLEGRATYYVTATLQDDTVKNGMLILDWEQMTEVLPFTAAPEFTPNGGTIEEGETITLTCSDPDAKIYYAVGQYMNPFFGNELQDYAIEYTGSFTIKESGLLVVQSCADGKAPSNAVEADFQVKGGAQTLGDIETITFDDSRSNYDEVILTSDDHTYKTIMNTGNGMPTVSEYYLLVSQNGADVRHLYNGGVRGFSVEETKDGGSKISILLEKGQWNLKETATLTFIAKGYANKELSVVLGDEEIAKQEDVEASKGNEIVNREDVQVGKTYTAQFTAIKTGTNDESMLAGFFEPIAKVEVGQHITKITFRNMVMPDQLQDFGLKGSGEWQGAVEDGERIETETEALFTIPVSTEDFKEGLFTGGVNVLAMGGSLANNGLYSTYTSVEITFADEIEEGFGGFEGNINGLTEEIIRNRNLLVGAPGIDANGDGYVSDDEIRAYAPESKKLNLSTGNLTGLGYSTFDNIQMEDITWIKLLNPQNFISIDLSGHHIAEITNEFKGFSELTVLNLRANNIRTIEDGAFSDLGKLEELGLSSNLLTTITDKTFTGLTNIGKGTISEFGLGQNAITYIAANAFEDMKYVKGLFLYENQLESLPKGVLNGMDSLKILYIESNHLKSVPADIESCGTLKEVKLYNNEISSVSGAFCNTIETIDLSGNYIEEVPKDLLNTNRKRILLEDNAIKTMTKEYALKALEDSANFGTVFKGNPVQVDSISGLSQSQKSQVSSALKGVASTVVGLEIAAEEGKVSYTSTLTAFDYFFWNLAMQSKNKGAVKQALGKEVISNVADYQKFREINLKSFSKEDVAKSILSDDFGTIVDYTITTRLQILNNGTWITIDSSEVKGEDDKTFEYEIDAMKDGQVYRVIKTVGKYKVIAQDTASVKEEEKEEEDSENGTYSIEIKMLHANDDGTLSMANGAINNVAEIGLVDGKAILSIDFKPMVLAGTDINGHLLKFWIYDDPNPMIAKTYDTSLRKEVAYSEFYDQEDGKKPVANDKGQYPGKVTFEMPYFSDTKGYDKLYGRVGVDAMAGYDQNVIVALDYTTLKKISEEPPVVPPTTKPDTSSPDTSNPDTSNPDTSNPDTNNPDTTNPDKNDGKVDIKNLKDGVYSVSGKMLKTDRSSLSMANSAFNDTVKLTVKNGKYTIRLDFKGMDINGMYGYLGKLHYYNNGYTVGNNGVPQGSVSETTMLSIQKDTNGVPITDRYGTNYPDTVSFPLIANALNDGYVPLQVYVPIMDAISAGSGKQSVYLHLDWNTLKSTSVNNSVFDDNSTNEPNDADIELDESILADQKVDTDENVEVEEETVVVESPENLEEIESGVNRMVLALVIILAIILATVLTITMKGKRGRR